MGLFGLELDIPPPPPIGSAILSNGAMELSSAPAIQGSGEGWGSGLDGAACTGDLGKFRWLDSSLRALKEVAEVGSEVSKERLGLEIDSFSRRSDRGVLRSIFETWTASAAIRGVVESDSWGMDGDSGSV